MTKETLIKQKELYTKNPELFSRALARLKTTHPELFSKPKPKPKVKESKE